VHRRVLDDSASLIPFYTASIVSITGSPARANPVRRRDVAYLFAARSVRLFAYGFLSVILALYLAARGFDTRSIGVLLSLTLAGDAGISLWLTLTADRFGRRRTLLVGAALMTGAGLVFAWTGNWAVLAAAAIIGVISPSGNEIGPFLPVEQASLAEIVPGDRRTSAFAWYQLAGALATAVGALAGGLLARVLQQQGMTALDAYRTILVLYALAGGVIAVLVTRLSPSIEVAVPSDAPMRARFGLHRSTSIVARLSALFALDAFGGGLVLQSVMAYWFHTHFGVDEAALGAIFFGANLLAAVSALAAARIAARIGLLRTMVVTHMPSNVLLALVPFMPTLPLAIGVLLLRFSISQMDVPTRQSYTLAVVAPDERSAAAGLTGIARSVGAAAAPALGGVIMSAAGGAPFVAAGALKFVYDVLLYVGFKAHRPPEERPETAHS
jgi:MFS family permease